MWAPTDRDSHDIEALVTDRYIETLLAAHAHTSHPGPAPAESGPAFRLTIARLARDLPRFHPSFRFEEALADRLAKVAAGLPTSSPTTSAPTRPAGTLTILPTKAIVTPSVDLRPAMGRPLLIGGALTSAALSLAGAYLAWRFKRPPSNPMARAVRAIARTRLA
jgi:hypothetical protein